MIANGKVINGINGCTRLIRESCFITAHDARTGRELWRTYTIARPGEPGGDTWGDLPLELRGGGDVWNTGSYDPDLGLVYFGVAQAKPWASASRGLTMADSALYTSSTLALDENTGEIVWYRQHVPAESLDLDEGMEQVLLDVEGVPALLTIGKHGVLWKLDRRDGSFLGVKETVFQNILDIDPEMGTVQYRADIRDAQVGAVGIRLSLDSRREELARHRLSSGYGLDHCPVEPELHGLLRTGGRIGRRRAGAPEGLESGGRCPEPTATWASSAPTTSERWRKYGACSSGRPSSPPP